MINLSILPFGPLNAPPDVEPAGCAEPWGETYAVPAPADRLLPFHWARPHSDTRRLDCAELLDADTGQVLHTLAVDPALPLAPLYLPVEVYEAGGMDYVIYYGNLINGLALDCQKRYRLRLDGEVVSAAFQPYDDLSTAVSLEWWSDSPLGGVPYGTGLHQRLIIPGATVWNAAPRETTEESKDAFGRTVLDFRAVTQVSTFETPPVPFWLQEALSGIRSHGHVQVAGYAETTGPRVAVSFTDSDRCRAAARVEVEGLDALAERTAGCSTVAPLVLRDADGYAVRRWRCGDTSDTEPDFLDTGETRCEMDTDPTWQDTGETRCQQADQLGGGGGLPSD